MGKAFILIKLGYKFCNFHNKLRLFKDTFFKPLVSILPKKVSANHITLFRFIGVLIWLPFTILKPALEQSIIFFIVYFFDLYDGAVARFKKQKTYFGKYFDAFSDRENHIVFLTLLLNVTKWQILALKIWWIWELFLAVFLIFEYFLKNVQVAYLRSIFQQIAKIIIWPILIYEIIKIYL